MLSDMFWIHDTVAFIFKNGEESNKLIFEFKKSILN